MTVAPFPERIHILWMITFGLLSHSPGYAHGNCAAALKECDGENGSKCTDGTCLSWKNWCEISAGKTCANSMDDSYCASFKFTTGAAAKDEYLFIAAATDWPEAEMLCQSRGYNLVSIRDYDDVAAIGDFLKGLADENKENFLETNVKGDLCDPLKKINKVNFKDGLFWTGIYHNYRLSKWMNTDNSSIDKEGTKCVTSGTLGACTQEIAKTCNNCPKEQRRFYLAYTPTNGYTILPVNRPNPRSMDNIMDTFKEIGKTPYALCVKRASKKSIMWSDLKNDTCLKGFRCPNKGKCLYGLNWEESQVCDGKKDCPGGEDEAPEACGAMTSNDTAGRKWLLIPSPKRESKEVAMLCAKRAQGLPCVTNATQLAALMDVPAQYVKSLSNHTFAGAAHDWANMEWNIRLGITGGKGKAKKWLDGTPVDLNAVLGTAKNWSALEAELKQADLGLKKHEEFVVLNSKGEIVVTSTGKMQNFLTVCEDSSSYTKGAQTQIFTNFYLTASHVTMVLVCLLLHQRWA